MQKDLSISLLRANIIGSTLIVPIVVISTAPYLLVHGSGALMLAGWIQVGYVIGLTFLGAVAHEFLHALGFRFVGTLDRTHVRIGFNARAMAPYVHVDCPVSVAVYRIALVLPGVLLGILPLVGSIVLGSSVLLWFSVLSLITSAGDMIVLWLLRKVNGAELALDHPERAGCLVGSPHTPIM